MNEVAKTNGGVATTEGASGYLQKHGTPMMGKHFKFDGKSGGYKVTSDESFLKEDTQVVVVYPQIQAGWIKFNGKGNPPDREMGPIFSGFVPPDRSTLGDQDETKWEKGLDGKPQNPWQFQLMVPMQVVETGELLIFSTRTNTGKRAVDNLIEQCERMQQREPDFYPIIKLGIGGFQHRDERVGWVKTPALPRVGKAPKSDVSMATTSVADAMSDEIPW
jgi:hypothetical protein